MAVVRVKRHCDDEPRDTLLLACKRRKTEDDQLTSIFKFATTVTNQDENLSKHIPKKGFNVADAKSNFKSPSITDITEKLRAENKLFSQNNRFKVVNFFRALSESDSLDGDEGTSSERGLTVVDVESLPVISSETSTTSTLATADTDKNASNYVYDIYYAPDCRLDDKMLDDDISCHILDDLVFDDCATVFDAEDDSDDSNDENNWRNDYPDKDPDSIDEDDMKLACNMGYLNLGETNSLSSDEGEEGLVYGMDDPSFQAGSLDPDDVYHFGYDYAVFKNRVTRGSDSESENSDFFYCDGDLESD